MTLAHTDALVRVNEGVLSIELGSTQYKFRVNDHGHMREFARNAGKDVEIVNISANTRFVTDDTGASKQEITDAIDALGWSDLAQPMDCRFTEDTILVS